MAVPRGAGGRKTRPSKREEAEGGNHWLAFAVGGGIAAVVGVIAVLVLGRGGSSSQPETTAPVATAPAPVSSPPVAPSFANAAPPVTPASSAGAATAPNPGTGTAIPPETMALVQKVTTEAGIENPLQKPAGSASAEALPTAPAPQLNYADLVEKTDRSVVRLNVQTVRGPSVGSGFVVSETGIVVTNYHVIEGGKSIAIEFEDGRKCGVDGFKLYDQDRDIAIIQLSKDGGPFVPVPLAEHMPRKGEDVAAFGAPLGLSFTASKGTITNIRNGKELEMEGTYIQTDTSISPGNSGGPLVSMAGEVVGMNSFQLRVGQNLNFAVSSFDIREVLKASEREIVKEINPKSVPTRKQEMPKLVDISGTERADKLLAQISQAALFIKPFEIDPTGRINEYMFDNLKKTVKTKLKVELTRINELRVDESVIILGVMWAPPEDETLQERLASQMSLEMVVVMLDVTKDGERVPSIVFKDEAKLAVLSISALAQGNLTNSVRDGAKKFFDRFSSTVIKARKAAGVQ